MYCKLYDTICYFLQEVRQVLKEVLKIQKEVLEGNDPITWIGFRPVERNDEHTAHTRNANADELWTCGCVEVEHA